MQTIDFLLHPHWIVPVEPRQTVLTQHSIAIDQGIIVDILPRADIATYYQAREQVMLDRHVLVPGLVNAHGHASMALLRGIADDQPLHRWLNEYIWPAEAQWLSEDFVRAGSELAVAEMLRSGTTCFSDMYFFPNIVGEVALAAGIRAQLCCPVMEFANAWAQSIDEYIDGAIAVRERFQQHALVDVALGPHSPYALNDSALQQVAELAAAWNSSLQIHLHETQREVDDAIKQHGRRPLQHLDDLGLLTPRTQCVHMVALDDNDIATVSKRGSHVVHCPASNLKLASGFCPLKKLLDNNVNVAVGTDGAASNNTLNMLAETRTAALLAKAVANDSSALPAWQALELATLGGAKAIGLAQQIGSLVVGKQADIVAIDMSDIEQQPLFDLCSQLIYSDCGGKVSDSWIAGKRVLTNKQPVNLDLQSINEQTMRWRDKINSNIVT